MSEQAVINYYNQINAWVNTSEEHYDYNLGVVPPLCFDGRNFLVGECYSEDKNWNPIYLGFLYFSDKILHKLCSVAEFQNDRITPFSKLSTAIGPRTEEERMQGLRQGMEKGWCIVGISGSKHFKISQKTVEVKNEIGEVKTQLEFTLQKYHPYYLDEEDKDGEEIAKLPTLDYVYYYLTTILTNEGDKVFFPSLIQQ